MADWMRKQLEELMGAEALTGRAPEKLTYEDPKVCRDFLCGLCPNDLFTNTRSEVGPCTKVHGDKYKIEYEEAKKSGKHPGFDHEHIRNLDNFVGECDRRIQASQKRLERTTAAEDPRIMELVHGVNDVTEAMAALMADIEKLGEDGKVEEASKLMDEVDRLKREKDEKERELRALNKGAVSQQQKLRVCEVCGAHLSVYDSDRRLADHFGGKMHLGYVQIREALEKLKEQFPGALSSGGRDFRGGPPGQGFQNSRGGGGGPAPYRDRRDEQYPPRRDYRDDYYRDQRDRGGWSGQGYQQGGYQQGGYQQGGYGAGYGGGRRR